VRELETERLRLVPWAPAHGVLLARLAAIPEVMRFIGTGATWPADRAREHHERALAHWRDHGFGWRAAVERASGREVGLIALNLAGPDVPELAADDHEVGWWLDPAVWGAGYASEGGRALVDEAFTRIGAPSVVARVRPANAASLRVASALGLRAEATAVDRLGMPVRILRLAAPGSNPAVAAARAAGPRGEPRG
jgi:RimJ/RimL family protein N-acetyltransferase